MSKWVRLMPSSLDDIVLYRRLGMPDGGYAVLVDEDALPHIKEWSYRYCIMVDIVGYDAAGAEVFSTRDGDREAVDDVAVDASVVKVEDD